MHGKGPSPLPVLSLTCMRSGISSKAAFYSVAQIQSSASTVGELTLPR